MLNTFVFLKENSICNLCRLVAESVNYTGTTDIFQYVLLGYRICIKGPDGKELIDIQFILGRNYLIFFLTDFIPTILSNFIAYSTIFYIEENFETAIGVNLTILLVITTM